MGRAGVRSLLLLCCLGCQAAWASAGDRLGVFVSIPPQQYLVERIGGGRVEVRTMVPPGASPELYDPTPRQMTALARARIYFRICVPFEAAWIGAIADANPVLRIVDCNREIHYRADDSGTGNPDPHVWTSPRNARLLAAQIRTVLCREDPAGQDRYQENFRRLDAELADLDRELAGLLAQPVRPYLLAAHGSWGYYADAYGLRQIPLEQDGREPGPRRLAWILDFARRQGIGVIFTQRQHRSGSAAALARELGAELVELDPLARDYQDNLRAVTRQVARAVR